MRFGMRGGGPTMTQFLDGLKQGQGLCWGLALLLAVVAGMIGYKEWSDWRAQRTKAREPDEPRVRDWLKRATLKKWSDNDQSGV